MPHSSLSLSVQFPTIALIEFLGPSTWSENGMKCENFMTLGVA